MRDPLVTRRLLAKIDREIDVYVVLDRFRQAIYDQDDYIAKLERDIKILQDADRARLTETGVNKLLDLRQGRSLKEWGTWALRRLLPWALLAALGIYVKWKRA